MNTWHLTAEGLLGTDGVEKLDQWIVHRKPYDKNNCNKGQTLELENFISFQSIFTPHSIFTK